MNRARLLLVLAVAAAACDRSLALPNASSVDGGAAATTDLAVSLEADLAPSLACLDRPAFTDCGPFAAACAGAIPLAYGGESDFIGTFTIDDQYVYWGISRSVALPGCVAAIMRTDKRGGPSTVLVGGVDPSVLVTDETYLYWFQYSVVQDRHLAALMRVRKSGGTPEALADVSTPEAPLVALTLANGYAYWFGWGEALFRMPITGGVPETLALYVEGLPGRNLVVHGDRLYWAGYGKGYIDNGVYGALYSIPVAGGPVAPLISDIVFDQGMVAGHGGSLYFILGTNQTRGGAKPKMTIGSAPFAGSPVTTFEPLSNVYLSELLADDASLIWNENSEFASQPSAIRAVPFAGGPPRQLWSGMARSADHIAADASAVYFRLPVGPPESEIYGTRGGMIVKVPR